MVTTIGERELEGKYPNKEVQFYGAEGERYTGEALDRETGKTITVKAKTRKEAQKLLEKNLYAEGKRILSEGMTIYGIPASKFTNEDWWMLKREGKLPDSRIKELGGKSSLEPKVKKATKYFTLKKAQDVVRTTPKNLTDEQLQKHIVKLRDFKGYIDRSDMERLVEGGYYGRVMDPSATGLVPKDPWLQTNLGQSLDEALAEKQKRLATPKPRAEKGKATIEEIKGWPEAKKAWVRQEASKLTAKGFSPAIQELGMAYDKAPVKKRVPEPKAKPIAVVSPKPRTEEAQSEYKELMKPRLEAHDKEIKAANDRFMAGEMTPREMEEEHKKIHAKTDAIAATMRRRVWGKYAEALPSRAELEKVQRMRSSRSQSSDLARKHSVVISPDNPKVAAWLHDQGKADITGIDTPRLGRKGTPRITPKTPRLRR